MFFIIWARFFGIIRVYEELKKCLSHDTYDVLNRNEDRCHDLQITGSQTANDMTKEPFVQWHGLVSEALTVEYMEAINEHPNVGNLTIKVDNVVYTCPRSWVTSEVLNAGPDSMDSPMIKLLLKVFTTAPGVE